MGRSRTIDRKPSLKTNSPEEKAILLFRNNGGVLKSSHAFKLGIHPEIFYALKKQGTIKALSRGLYHLAESPLPDQPDFYIVAQRVPEGVICLISALSFHELTTQIPRNVAIALKKGSELPRLEYPPMQFHWFSGKAFQEGIETHAIHGASLRVYSQEKSIADVFKYRNKLGVDIAIEALRIWLKRPGFQMNTLMKYARTCRVETIIKTYLEAIL